MNNKVGFHPPFSRQGIADASIALLFWLNENVHIHARCLAIAESKRVSLCSSWLNETVLILGIFILVPLFYSCANNSPEQNFPHELDSIMVADWAKEGPIYKVGNRVYPLSKDSASCQNAKENHILMELLDEDTLYVVTDSPILFGDTLSCFFYGNEALKNFFGQQLYDIDFWEDDIPYGAIVQNEKDTFLFGKNHWEPAPYTLQTAVICAADRGICGIKVGQGKNELFNLLGLSNIRSLDINYLALIYPCSRQYKSLKICPSLNGLNVIYVMFQDNKIFRIYALSGPPAHHYFELPNCEKEWKYR